MRTGLQLIYVTGIRGTSTLDGLKSIEIFFFFFISRY